ncbi:MAG: CHASE2 domain-containing protein [Proteobacteria bacterium]|nr:CHASE2 domain-containing protein [Pseudomonadota bacterium]
MDDRNEQDSQNLKSTGWSDYPLARFVTAKHGRPLAFSILILVLIFQVAAVGDDFSRLRYAVFDLYHRAQPRTVENFPVVIVAVDQKSLSRYGQWPWPRTLVAELIEKTSKLSPLAIGLDVIFAEADRSSLKELSTSHPDLSDAVSRYLLTLPSNDDIMARKIKGLPVVLARAAMAKSDGGKDVASHPTTMVQLEGAKPHPHLPQFDGHIANRKELADAAAGHGYINATPDPDGTIRNMHVVMMVNGKIVPSMGLELLRVASKQNWFSVKIDSTGVTGIQLGDAEISVGSNGQITPHFSVSDDRRRVSAADVLSGAVEPGAFAGQIALIGVTALGLVDAPPTPVAARMDGVEIQAQFIENLLSGSHLGRPGEALLIEILMLVIFGGLMILLVPKLGPVLSIILLVLFIGVQFGVGFAAFSQAKLLLDIVFAVVATALIFGTLVFADIIENDRRRRLLTSQLEAEKLDNARMAGELNAAREIQMGILPDSKSIKNSPGTLDVYAFLEPAKEVGGDLYDLFMVDDDHLFFLVGDVSGKGVPASLFMALSKALCKSAALRGEGKISELMSTANDEISRENPASMFVTTIAGVIDARTGELEFCNAGHDHPYVCYPGRPPRLLESTGGPPLCVIDGFPYPMERARLEPGETLVLFTDGVTEAMTATNKMYGLKRLSELLTDQDADLSAQDIVEALYDDVKIFVDRADPSDDITIMAVQYLGNRKASD